MLRLANIVKDYISGDSTVHALKGVSISFRKNEFVSILGHSGCGKTTLLNIIGGLDHYTSGDLVINQTSTKKYKDRDWDNYRNHSIGFVFQSYNLIPHQTVLSNVELALTLSGVKRAERKALAQAALVRVGLADQIHKRPNQLSGGQMQRVAIARAIVNNPDIILADEPTGALDTETSEQVMQILKEIAQDKLVIMVTHNPELAELYSTRIVRLKDGEVVSDSMPYDEEEERLQEEAKLLVDDLPQSVTPTSEEEVATDVAQGEGIVLSAEPDKEDTPKPKKVKGRKKKPSMSFFTAFSLSIKNLFTKKGRTFLTAFAGSIGIIGIALILSLSNGFQNYIDMVERDTLSAYPITISETSLSLESVLELMVSDTSTSGAYPKEEVVKSNDVLTTLLKGATGAVNKNDLASFKTWLEANPEKVGKITNAVKYIYNTNFCVYEASYGYNSNTQLYPFEVPASVMKPLTGDNSSDMSTYMNTMLNGLAIWEELVDNRDLLENKQYDLLTGHWPRSYAETDNQYFEVVLVVDKYNRIDDYLMCAIGLETITDAFLRAGGDPIVPKTYDFDELIGREYKIILGVDKYQKTDDGWQNQSNNKRFIKEALDNGVTIKISGIIRPKDTVTTAIMSGVIGYNHDLTEYIIQKTNEHPMVLEQKANTEINVLTGEAFEDGSDAEFVLSELGAVSSDKPSSIYLYAKGFEEKKAIGALVEEYNSTVPPEKQIKYNDMMATLMESVSTIIQIISYVLIAFVSISLIVSSIMIGIITYISVLERTKEIGVLRSIGASKRDVSRLFNAETLTVGFMSGLFGIIITLLLNIPVNLVIAHYTGIKGLSSLPVLGAFALIGISMFLSFLAGFIPSKVAAKKDPVVALRTE
ncbi:MAG TPA: ABC transporter [Clostridiales bacterium]|nr:ABC transporter [Clostridiales bacterium]